MEVISHLLFAVLYTYTFTNTFYKLNVDLNFVSFPVLSHLLTTVTLKPLMFYKLPVDLNCVSCVTSPVLSQLFTPITFDALPIAFRTLIFYKLPELCVLFPVSAHPTSSSQLLVWPLTHIDTCCKTLCYSQSKQDRNIKNKPLRNFK